MDSLKNRKPSGHQHLDERHGSTLTPLLGGSEMPRKSILLSYDELPAWYRDNPHIHHGYRPESRSALKSLESLLYLHNESMNIYTHLIPAVMILTGGFSIYNLFHEHYPQTASSDIAIFVFYLATAAVCFTVSASFHTLCNHSEDVCNLWVRFDFAGILFLILGCFVSGIKMGFYCEPTLRAIYWTMIIVLGAITGVVVLNARFQGPQWRNFRLTAFIATGLSAFAPIIHGTISFGFVQLVRQSGLAYYLGEGLLIIVGSVVYQTRFPERISPGKFDIWFSSHQIFHILTVVATAVHLVGLTEAYKYNYNNRFCNI